MTTRATNVVSGLGGAASAYATDALVQRLPFGARRHAWSAGLVVAAGIYSAARRGGFGDRREQAVLAVATALAGVVAASPEQQGRRLIAAGWAGHGLFDAAFVPHDGSRIPGWYPALCAGYDLAAAAVLLRD